LQIYPCAFLKNTAVLFLLLGAELTEVTASFVFLADPSSSSASSRAAIVNRNVSSPRTGAASAPVNALPRLSNQQSQLPGQLSSETPANNSPRSRMPSLPQLSNAHTPRRGRSSSIENENSMHTGATSFCAHSPRSPDGKRVMSDASASLAKARARTAQKENDSMVYLDGPQVYTCANCRTHLTSHDDIISKSFHGRHGKIFMPSNSVINPCCAHCAFQYSTCLILYRSRISLRSMRECHHW
jgi:hypothetical protein